MLDRGQHGDDQRLEQRVGPDPGGQDGERDLIMRALPDPGHPHLHLSGT